MANLITIGRVVLAFGVIYLMVTGGPVVLGWCAVAIVVVILLDGLDGVVARVRHETSQFGAIWDIVGDRVVENALWMTFAYMRLIPLWVPLLVLARGFVVDGLRSAGYEEGQTPFGANNMMRSKLSAWLTAGRFMRALFGGAKMLGFVFLAGLAGYRMADSAGTLVGRIYDVTAVRAVGWCLVWTAVVLTVVRAVPVLIDATAYIRAKDARARLADPA